MTLLRCGGSHLEKLWNTYKDKGVQVLVVDVKESKEIAFAWVKKMGFTFPVLLDAAGKVAESYAPEGVLPDLPRDQIPIASNLIVDGTGKIRFFSLLDSRNFDAKLVALNKELDKLLAQR